jgi:hypothetical protein
METAHRGLDPLDGARSSLSGGSVQQDAHPGKQACMQAQVPGSDGFSLEDVVLTLETSERKEDSMASVS